MRSWSPDCQQGNQSSAPKLQKNCRWLKILTPAVLFVKEKCMDFDTLPPLSSKCATQKSKVLIQQACLAGARTRGGGEVTSYGARQAGQQAAPGAGAAGDLLTLRLGCTVKVQAERQQSTCKSTTESHGAAYASSAPFFVSLPWLLLAQPCSADLLASSPEGNAVHLIGCHEDADLRPGVQWCTAGHS